jgi:hypothetical protein
VVSELKGKGVWQKEKNSWRCNIRSPSDFEKLKVDKIAKGVMLVSGKLRSSDRHELQGYLFDREAFKAQEQARQWLDRHLKGEIRTFLDYKAFNEYRRRAVNAYMQISSVSE